MSTYEESPILWEPSADRREAAALTRFTRKLGAFTNYRELHRFSVDEPEVFWPALWTELGLLHEGALSPALVPGESMADARWFPNVRLSFAENLLERGGDDDIAIVARTPEGGRRTTTRAELRQRAANVARWLRERGVGPGDRVAAILPNAAPAVACMLATNSLGAIWSLSTPELGLEATLDRFGQIAPRILIATGRGGPRVDPLRRARLLCERLPSIEHVLIVDDDAAALIEASELERASSYEDLPDGSRLTYARLPYAHPSFILYTSGTTGLPKCIVHGMGGMLLQLWKELVIHYDLRRGDRFLYYTSTGWNMWYWVVIALAAEATIVLWDGSPFAPTPTALFDVADEERLDVLGISPPYLATLRAGGVSPRSTHRLESIRAILSTGSPLSPELYDWVYAEVKRDVALISLSGGTEINACFGTGNPAAPVRRGEMQVLALGMAVDVFDDEGCSTDELGELVATKPFPSQPVGFWNDPGDVRYHATYFARFPGAWCHGDLARITPSGGLVIEGRSDATLKPGGHRIGTAEIYRQLEHIPGIVDAVAVGQRWEGDIRVVLFVVLAAGTVLDAALEAKIRRRLVEHASPHHAPARILAVGDVPRTATGKKAELAVRAIVHREPVRNVRALVNPDALDDYRDRPELTG